MAPIRAEPLGAFTSTAGRVLPPRLAMRHTTRGLGRPLAAISEAATRFRQRQSPVRVQQHLLESLPVGVADIAGEANALHLRNRCPTRPNGLVPPGAMTELRDEPGVWGSRTSRPLGSELRMEEMLPPELKSRLLCALKYA